MDNQKYVASLGVSKENQRRCLETMEKYDDNHWWEPDVDPRKCAYYQIKEPIQLVAFSHFHEAIELLLGRPVYTHEFALNAEGLKQEAERAWTYQVGCTSDSERRERVQAAIDGLLEWGKQNGKRIVQAQSRQEK